MTDWREQFPELKSYKTSSEQRMALLEVVRRSVREYEAMVEEHDRRLQKAIERFNASALLDKVPQISRGTFIDGVIVFYPDTHVSNVSDAPVSDTSAD